MWSIPFVGGFAPRLGKRLVGLQRIVDQDHVGAASGQHAADRGGERVPWRVVEELLHRLAVRGRRVGKICRYQALPMMLRQSRASLSARSWP